MTIINFEHKNDTTNLFGLEGSIVDFDMKEERLEHFGDKKGIYKVNEEGEIIAGLGIVGHHYPLHTHVDFFRPQQDMIRRKFPSAHLENIQINYRTSRNGAWALQDTTFPEVKHIIDTGKHTTKIALRNVSWHSVNGSTSNNAIFGTMDFFCTNLDMKGEYSLIKMKNTKHFDMRRFIQEIEESVEEFYITARKYQAWANRDITFQNAEDVVVTLPVADRNKVKLLNIYQQEATTRGNNLWALYSSFTNYSSHTDNGFTIRKTTSDHTAQTMLKREFEVASWVENEEFVRLAA